MKYLMFSLILLLSACSLIIETGTPIEESDTGEVSSLLRDAEQPPSDSNPMNDSGDGLPDTMSVADMIAPADVGVFEDMMNMQDSEDMGSPIEPECSESTDCPDLQICEAGLCVTVPCEPQCSDGDICVAACCQPTVDSVPEGACAHPIEARLGRNLVGTKRVAEAGVAAIECLLPDEPGFTHSFFAFRPDSAGEFCVRGLRGSVDQGTAPLAIIVRRSCCEMEDVALDCAIGTVTDPAPRESFQGSPDTPTIVHLYGPYRENMGIEISGGACGCETTADCALGEACINQTCINRLGSQCEPEDDCGRLASCRDGICQSG